jgi:predicted transcriptional regulator
MTRKTPLDDVEYLASSGYRVEVLKALADGTHTRPELRDSTGIPQPTLGRILTGFEERGWIERAGGEYRITGLGSMLAEDFAGLLETVGTVQDLAEIRGQLPIEEMDFDLRLLREARITVPRPPDVFAHFRRGEEIVRDAAAVRTLVSTFSLDTLPKQREWVLERGQREEVIMAADAFDGLVSRPEAIGTVLEVLASENMSVYRYEGEVPFGLTLADDVALIVPYDEENVPCALIETENETVRGWVVRTLDEYRDRATEVTVEDLPE